MKMMRAMLHTHNEWFKLQMCKDRFENLLRIDSLKEVNTPMLSACSMSKSNADSCTQASYQVTVSSTTRLSEDGGSPTQVSSRDVICDENAILKVMVSCVQLSPFHSHFLSTMFRLLFSSYKDTSRVSDIWFKPK